MAKSPTNIYEKIIKARALFLEANVKKTGENKFQKFNYFELEDIVPPIVKICNELKILPLIEFKPDSAILKVIDVENPDDYIVFCSPIPEVKGDNLNKVVQDIGKIQTYLRRYLYLQFMDIVENDAVDATDTGDKPKTTPKSKGKGKSAAPKPAKSKNKSKPPAPPAPKSPGKIKDVTPEPEDEVNPEHLKKACEKFPLLRNIIKALKLEAVLLNEENIRNELIDDERCPPGHVDKIMNTIMGVE